MNKALIVLLSVYIVSINAKAVGRYAPTEEESTSPTNDQRNELEMMQKSLLGMSFRDYRHYVARTYEPGTTRVHHNVVSDIVDSAAALWIN